MATAGQLTNPCKMIAAEEILEVRIVDVVVVVVYSISYMAEIS